MECKQCKKEMQSSEIYPDSYTCINCGTVCLWEGVKDVDIDN